MPASSSMKPLVFGPRSILAWQQHAKTQTRRLVRPLPGAKDWKLWQNARNRWEWYYPHGLGVGFGLCSVRQPYAVGDLLWIREGLKRGKFGYVLYATHPFDYLREEDTETGWPWTWKRDKLPAIFMPKWACRYYARVVSVRPERLQDITDLDALAEGTLVERDWQIPHYQGGEHDLYIKWWDQLHRKPGTRSEDNPWLWRYVLRAS